MSSDVVISKKAYGFIPKFSWGLFDFANTAYVFIVMTLAGVRYFDAAGVGGELYYGISFFVSMIVSGIVVPMMGALSDRFGHPKLGVIILSIISVITMVLMGMTQNLVLLFIFLLIGNLTFQSSLVLYDALLPLLIRNNDEAGKVSGLGVGLGYLGSIVAAGLVMVILPNVMFNAIETEHIVDKQKKSYYLEVRDDKERTGQLGKVRFIIDKDGKYQLLPKSFRFDEADGETGQAIQDYKDSIAEIKIEDQGDKLKIVSKTGKFIKLEYSDDKFSSGFFLGAILFIITAIPFVLFVPERRVNRVEAAKVYDKPALSQVFATVRSLPSNKPLFFFLLGAFMCQDVQNTAILYLSKLTSSMFMPPEKQLVLFLLLINTFAAGFSFIQGYLSDKVGPRFVLIIGAFGTLCGLAITTIIPQEMFFAMAAIVILGGGFGIAAFWVAGRKLLLILAPPAQVGEYFGFLNLTKKFAVLGIILFPLIKFIAFQNFHYSEATSYRIALAGQLPLLILGIFFLFLIKIPKKSEF